QVQNTSVKTNQNPSLEENNSIDSTNRNQTQEVNLSYYSPNDDFSDSEESKALMVKHHIRIVSDRFCFISLKRMYEEIHEFPDLKYMFDLKTKGLTTPKKEWNYREDEDPSCYNLNWDEYRD
ncbi:9909_t:CDS:2, partial [Funneliformis geosporum]